MEIQNPGSVDRAGGSNGGEESCKDQAEQHMGQEGKMNHRDHHDDPAYELVAHCKTMHRHSQILGLPPL